MTIKYIIGIDEVGRGPLAGPLCVGACLVKRKDVSAFYRMVSGIKDSKKLTHQMRLKWLLILTEAAKKGECVLSTAFVGQETIDRKGLSYCLKLGIRRTLQKINAIPRSSKVLLDGGIKAPAVFTNQETIIKGDEKEPLIAVASIVAKVRRDRYMIRLSKQYPQYGFDEHKGYGTKAHYVVLNEYGICPVHRRSFLKKFSNQID